MNKEELIIHAEDLYHNAFDANAYYLIMKQYGKVCRDYKEEMNLSPAFYQVVYGALQRACFMEIAKIYDKSKDVISLGMLLGECQDNIEVFPEYRTTITYEEDGKEYFIQVPYKRFLKPSEECFFREEVKSQREIFKLLDYSNSDTMPVQVELKFSEFLELHKKRFRSLSKKRERIRVQRNKIYAHNDEKCILNEEKVWEKYPITYSDTEELIVFALDCTRLILGALTNVDRAEKYVNIDDWEGTLMIARLGLKYRDYDLQQKEQQYREELNVDKNEE